MKQFLILYASLISSFGFSQVTLFQDSFDTYNDFVITGFGQWRTLDLDMLNTYTGGTVGPATWANAGDPQAFQIFNPTTALVTNATNGVGGETENRNFDPRTGAKYAACWAGVPSDTGGPTANDDWLISPPISLSGVTGSALSVWVKSMSDTFGLDAYRIGVYIGSGNPTSGGDFTIISGPLNLTAPYGVWAERTQSLAAYEGQTIRIGINCRSNDTYMFMVDDFKVTATALSTTDFTSSKFSVYPNPSNHVVTISNKESIQIKKVAISDIHGRTVKSLSFQGVTETEINVSDLNVGVYFMSIDTNEGIVTKKIVRG